MANQEERRKFPRFNFLVDVSFKKKAAFKKEKLSITKNISGVGVCLISYEELKVDDNLELKVFMPETKKPMKVMGRVAWVREFVIGDPQQGKRYDVGVEFLGLSEEDKEKINQHLFTLSTGKT
jgi:c-di-GMP-binding flagellar brake protein YcgR